MPAIEINLSDVVGESTIKCNGCEEELAYTVRGDVLYVESCSFCESNLRDEISRESYDEGYDYGRDLGHEEGYEEGLEEGYTRQHITLEVMRNAN